MKLLDLEIANVRGIRELKLKPDGRNLAIWGPNGSGKSAVVDAVDFLLTGQINRLTGKGTGGITLKAYGPRIGCKPQEAGVRARVEVDGVQVVMERSMAHPADLKCDPAAPEGLGAILSLARRGQHVLTRREILRYIQAEPSTRAQEIQELLGMEFFINMMHFAFFIR